MDEYFGVHINRIVTYSPMRKVASSQKRLKAMQESHSGFDLAEQDLLIRGAGQLAGSKQWGISDVGMEAIKNIKMVEAARTEAQKLLDTDPNLARHSLITSRLASKKSPCILSK